MHYRIDCAVKTAMKEGAMSTTETQPQAAHSSKDVLVTRVESYTREEPIRAVSAAFGVGILLTLLPIGGIISLMGRVVFLLARPLLMVLGLVKLADEWESRKTRAGEDAAHQE